jgi:short-subunit dehydrogenase
MRRQLRGLRMLITGASSGIGRALASEAARAGARLLLLARSQERLEALAREELAASANGDILTLPGDVTSEADRQRALDMVGARLGGLDVLVNNAGIACSGHFAEGSEEMLRQVMEVNFFAPAELIRQAIPLLTQGRQPAVVNVASMCGRLGLPAWPEYSASKFALCGLTEALRGELARFEIDTLLVVPGLTQTHLRQNLLRSGHRLDIDFDQGMPPEKVAQAILRALRANSTEVWVGRDARWMLRFHRFFPRWMDRLLSRRVKQLYARDRDKAPMTR